MKRVGREVLFLKTKMGNPRNGEGTMIRAKNGGILFVYTEYIGEDGADHAEAQISCFRSEDEGETWSSSRVMLRKPCGAQNIMSPSVFRMRDGGMGMVYLRKDVTEAGGVVCMPLFVRSDDEGETWSEPVVCGFPAGYYCAVNDSVCVTKAGRIYVATSYTGKVRDAMGTMKNKPSPHVSDVRIAYSDDNGKTWSVSPAVLTSPYQAKHGLFEPGIFEHEDGTLWLYARTAFGHQYQSFSFDQGAHFTPVEPNFRFTSPDSPMRVKRFEKCVGAIYNPMGYNCLCSATEAWGSPKRTPLVLTVSTLDGRDLNDPTKTAADGGLAPVAKRTFLLEEDRENSYCYPAALAVKDGILVAYYHSDGSEFCLNASKIIKIDYSELGL